MNQDHSTTADYRNSNKKAWEEAYDNRHAGWDDDMAKRLQSEALPYLNPMLRDAVRALDLQGKSIAQFCCNNGREILSIMQLGAAKGVGFDIAENMVAKAQATAKEAGIACTFVATDILKIGTEYTGAFDLVLFTIGAITWFEDLRALFQVAARCLKPGGTLLINDFHPFVNMLALPGEEPYDPALPQRPAYSYFRTEPWIESNSGAYMTDHHNSKSLFTSFSHTMGAIVSAVADCGLRITSLREFDRDIGMTDACDGKGFPMSYILRAEMPA